jgi:hypothetical protein
LGTLFEAPTLRGRLSRRSVLDFTLPDSRREYHRLIDLTPILCLEVSHRRPLLP